MGSKDVCPQCGGEYQKISMHWTHSRSCEHPPLTQTQREITTGLLMGDGCIDYSGSGNPRIESDMISKNYLEYIDGEFGVFGHGVTLKRSAEQSANRQSKTGFSPNSYSDNYSDLYRWRSMRHPELHEFADWYSTGSKVWPEDITLTPTVLKHWYCGDGNWDNSGYNNYISIAMANEVEYTDKVDSLFEKVGLPSPSNYNIYEFNDGHMNCDAQFTVDQSKELWEYMGEPLPDFEYKWPEQYR